MSDAPDARDWTPDPGTPERPERSPRDVDLGGRDRVAMARMAAANGDAGAAHAFAAGAEGSGDPAVAGEAAAVHGIAEARSSRWRRLRWWRREGRPSL